MTKIVSRPQIPLSTFEILLNITWPAQQWRNDVPVNMHAHNSFPIWQFLSNANANAPCVMGGDCSREKRNLVELSCSLQTKTRVLATVLFRFLVIVLICWPCLGENPIWYNLNSQLAIEYRKLLCGLLQTKHILNFQLKYERWEN